MIVIGTPEGLHPEGETLFHPGGADADVWAVSPVTKERELCMQEEDH